MLPERGGEHGGRTSATPRTPRRCGGLALSTGFRYAVGMFDGVDFPVAVVTVEGGGAVVVPVVERGGVLVERETGAVVELLDVVVVLGLPELERVAV